MKKKQKTCTHKALRNWPKLHILHGFFLQQRPDTLTTGAGHPVGDKLNLQTAGPRGPLLVQDVVFTDEMAHFDRERIPERVVHAKGAGECWALISLLCWFCHLYVFYIRLTLHIKGCYCSVLYLSKLRNCLSWSFYYWNQ